MIYLISGLERQLGDRVHDDPAGQRVERHLPVRLG